MHSTGFCAPCPQLCSRWQLPKRIVVGDLPHGGLLAVTLPVARFSLSHGVTAAFVLPVVVATAQREVLFDPHDLGSRLQPESRQAGGDDISMQRTVPDISDIPGEQPIGLPPVGTIIIENRALREIPGPDPATRTPARI